MTTLTYSILINASPKTIWKSLWEPQNYSIWTQPFVEGSHYKTNAFEEGSRIHLLSGKGEGMYSDIAELRPNEYLAFRHIGMVENYKEIPLDEETEKWSGSLESYTLEPVEGGTKVTALVETFETYVDSMNRLFPSAMEALKSLAEKQ